MKYDFDEVIPRRGTDSSKWDIDEGRDIIPMWVADMDFRTARPIVEALRKRAEHGIFGYTKVPDAYFDAVRHWFESRHGIVFPKEHLLFTTGVVPALSAIVKALTRPGDKVLVQTPVYNLFFSSIRNNGCEVVCSDLIYRDRSYGMDLEDMERKAADPGVKLLILCNPHNPAGRVWTGEELRAVGEICLRNGVRVISDEIHCDLTSPGFTHTPFASLGDDFRRNSVTCTAPSKTFNLAGLQCANIYAPDDEVRRRIDRALNINEVCEISPFAVEGLIAAYTEGGEWLSQLKQYLYENYIYLRSFFADNMPQFTVTPLEATYLVWVDCSSLGKPSDEIAATLLEGGVRINAGSLYGANGEGFIRINIACPRSILSRGLERIRVALA